MNLQTINEVPENDAEHTFPLEQQNIRDQSQEENVQHETESSNMQQQVEQQDTNEGNNGQNRSQEKSSDDTTHMTDLLETNNLTYFEKENNFVVGPDEYVDVLLRFKLDKKIVDPVSDREIRHVFTQTKIERKHKSGTIAVCPPPRTRILTRMAPMVQFKREAFPMSNEEI